MKQLDERHCWADGCEHDSIVREEYTHQNGNVLVTFRCGDHYDPDWVPKHGYTGRRVTART